MQRRPDIASAGSDLAFAALALIAGLAGAALAYAALIFAGSVAVWAWTRRRQLAQMNLRHRVTNSAMALMMMGAVLGLLYWIGLMFGGHT
jgi:hypothetical protein